MRYLLEFTSKFLENLEYQISLKENTYKNFKKIPVFTEQVNMFAKAVVNLEEKFEKIQIRDNYKIIITELDNLIKQAR
jgi:hypothetical protein